MSSRKAILEAIRSNLPAPTSLPENRALTGQQGELDEFLRNIRINGGDVVVCDTEEAFNTYRAATPQAPSAGEPAAWDQLGQIWLEGGIAVAENGAVWIAETQLLHRILPFICAHLVLGIRASTLVPDMQEAYARLSLSGEAPGYGAFIAGPSKTADIEQSLVIGAHGPLQHTVVIWKDA